MGKDVLMSINPKWCVRIFDGDKRFEVRKRAPLQEHPYKVYVYCTKNGEQIQRGIIRGEMGHKLLNGTVCGEFTVKRTIEQSGPWKDNTFGTCLTAQQLCEYAGVDGKLYYIEVSDVVLYENPKALKDFGIKRAPMSWQYVERRVLP